jgi:hypothetical protein
LVRDWRGVGGGRAVVLDLLLRGAEGREGVLKSRQTTEALN